MGLFGMQNRTFGAYLAGIHRILISVIKGVRDRSCGETCPVEDGGVLKRRVCALASTGRHGVPCIAQQQHPIAVQLGALH
jgi:hypothetical protein